VTTTSLLEDGATGSRASEDTRLHHVGFVVSSILDEIESFASSVGASWDGRIFRDPIQKVGVAFLKTSRPTDALIELVEPAGDRSPVLKFLKNGGGLHHLCYEVEDLDLHLELIHPKGAVVVRRPLPAVAFENRRIAWVLTKQKLLMEFLER
jgi:methylmalonyl-CoA/ethylmalonyl-CoA epimerase